jgi:hypothetical protein
MNLDSISTRQLQVRSQLVHRKIVNVVQNVGTNKSRSACILRQHGVFLPEHKTGSMKAPELVTSLSSFAIEIQSLNLQNVDTITDNCCIHLEKAINQFYVWAGWEGEFLQSHSSMPNPIEKMSSLIKSDIKI